VGIQHPATENQSKCKWITTSSSQLINNNNTNNNNNNNTRIYMTP